MTCQRDWISSLTRAVTQSDEPDLGCTREITHEPPLSDPVVTGLKGTPKLVEILEGHTRKGVTGEELRGRAFQMTITCDTANKQAMADDSIPCSWEDGKADEELFWARWIETKGSEWPDDFQERMDPTTELAPHLSKELQVPEGRIPVILDVGAGPMTVVGKRWHGEAIVLVAVDPLAKTYERLLAQSGVTAPVRTITAQVERLSESFEADFFDLVHIRNALDHSYDPLEGIKQMLTVVRKGAPAVLWHFRNEAVSANYGGFHQWNVDERDGRMLLWNKATMIDVNDELKDDAHVTVHGSERVVECIIRKHPQPAI
jgi:SAM-dependent methyltransferase